MKLLLLYPSLVIQVSIANSVLQSNTISFSKYIHPHVYMQYQNSNNLQLHNTTLYACCDLALSFPAAEVYHKLSVSQLHIQTWNRWIFSFDIDIVIIMLESYNQHLSAPISHDRITKALSRATMSSRNVDGLNTHHTKTHTYTGSNGRTNCELEILYYKCMDYPP